MDPSLLAKLSPAQLEKLPGLEPPQGVIPNFSNPPTLVPLGIAVLTLCITVTTILIAIRVYIRAFITRARGWDDATAILAWAGFVSYCAVGLHAAKYGDGVHQWNVHYYDLEPLAKLVNVQQIMYCPLMFFTKASILLLYLRIFTSTKKTTLAYVIYAVLAATFGLYFAQFFVTLLACIPRTKIWNPARSGHCLNLNLALEFSGAFNIAADFIILVLPIHSIWRLQMPTARKVQVSAVFVFGIFACVASIMRLVEQFKVASTRDLTYASFPVGLWTVGELAAGLVCGTLPVIPAFFRWFVPFISSKIKSVTHWRSSRDGKSTGAASAERMNSQARLKNQWPRAHKKYVELGEKVQPYPHTQSTTIHAGDDNASDETLHEALPDFQQYDERPDLEKGLPATPSETGIRKTIRMETYTHEG